MSCFLGNLPIATSSTNWAPAACIGDTVLGLISYFVHDRRRFKAPVVVVQKKRTGDLQETVRYARARYSPGSGSRGINCGVDHAECGRSRGRIRSCSKPHFLVWRLSAELSLSATVTTDHQLFAPGNGRSRSWWPGQLTAIQICHRHCRLTHSALVQNGIKRGRLNNFEFRNLAKLFQYLA